MQVFSVRGPDSQSFLLDPSFLNSFLPLAKKPFFFLLDAGLGDWAGLSAGKVSEGEPQASTPGGVTAGPAAGPGAESRSHVGVAVGGGSACSVGSGEGGSVSCFKGPGSFSSVEDVPPLEEGGKKFRVSTPNKQTLSL